MAKRVLLGNLGTSGASTLYGLRISKSGSDVINTDGSAVDVTNLLFDSVNPIGHLPIYKIYDVTLNAATPISGSNNKVVTPTNKTVSFGATLSYTPLVEAYEISGTNDYLSGYSIKNSYRSGFDYTRTTVPTDAGFFCTAYNDRIVISNSYQTQKTFRVFLMQPPASADTGADTSVNTVDWTDISVTNSSTGVGETNSQTITGINTNVTLRVSTGGTTISQIEAYNGGTQLATASNASTLDVTVGLNDSVKWRFTNPGVNTSITATVTNQTDGGAFVDSFGVDIESLPTYSLSGTTSVTEGGNCSYTVTTTSVDSSTLIYWQIVSGTTSDFSSTSGSFTAGVGAFSFTAKEDNTIESPYEDFTIEIATASGFGGSVKDSLSLRVFDAPASYNISGPGAIAEGGSGTFTVGTNNVANSTTLFWTINGTTADFTAVQGTLTINSNVGYVTVYPVADSLTENTEQYTISIRTGSYTGTVVASQQFDVSDTSVTPESGSLSPATASFTEGSGTVAFTATIFNQQSSTFNWQITRNSGTVGSGEFSTATSGTFTSTPYNISVGITNDSTSEINYQGESFTITLRSGGTVGSGTFLDSSTFTVYDDDTSVSAANLTIPNSSTAHSASITVTYAATGSAPGRIKNSSGTVLVNFTANSGTNSVFVNNAPSAGSTATYYVELYNGVVWLSGTSYTVTRLGTPTYSLTPTSVNLNEGSSQTFTFTTTNTLPNLGYFWNVESNPENPNGYISPLSGTVTTSGTSATNSGTFSLTATQNTEFTNDQGFIVKVYTGSNMTTLLDSSTIIVIEDDPDPNNGGGPPGCFIAGSKVLMADRTYKPIEEVQVGDKVIGLEEMINEVVDLRIHEEERRILCDLGNQHTFVTDTHPFLDSEGYWTAVNLSVAQEKYPNLQLRELAPGTTLMKYDVDLKAYVPYEVSYINQTVHNVKVYNLNVSGEDTPEIPGNDTYIVDGFIVHNK